MLSRSAYKAFRAAPSYFSFDELLCDNPLEAFQYQRMKERQGLAIPVMKEKEPEQEKNKENKDINQNVDVDEVFGFNEWEEQIEETQDPIGENLEKSEKDLKTNKQEVDSEVEDLFEYHVEEAVPSLSQEETQEHSPEEKEAGLELQKKNVSKIIAKYTEASSNVEENKKEEMQVAVKEIETTSPQKIRERYPNVDTKQFNWFQRLMHDYETASAPTPQVNTQNSQQQQQQPMEMEIQMYKEKRSRKRRLNLRENLNTSRVTERCQIWRISGMN